MLIVWVFLWIVSFGGNIPACDLCNYFSDLLLVIVDISGNRDSGIDYNYKQAKVD